jgi:hypothetical protein
MIKQDHCTRERGAKGGQARSFRKGDENSSQSPFCSFAGEIVN